MLPMLAAQTVSVLSETAPEEFFAGYAEHELTNPAFGFLLGCSSSFFALGNPWIRREFRS